MLSRGREAGGGDGGQSIRFAARRHAPSGTPGKAGHLVPGSNPDCATDSLRTRRRATSRFEKGARGVQP